jgi:hypothetical protein
MAEPWTEVEAAYRAGMPIAVICAKFGVTMAELIKRIREGDWKRDGDTSPPPSNGGGNDGAHGAEFEPVRLPAKIERLVERAAIDAAADIAREHRQLTRQLRHHFAQELVDFDAMRGHLATFRDENHIADLKGRADGGASLREYLTQCLAHNSKRVDALDKLARIGNAVVEAERAAWGLDEASDPEERTYEDLLREIGSTPITPRKVPERVFEFEARIGMSRSDE